MEVLLAKAGVAGDSDASPRVHRVLAQRARLHNNKASYEYAQVKKQALPRNRREGQGRAGQGRRQGLLCSASASISSLIDRHERV